MPVLGVATARVRYAGTYFDYSLVYLTKAVWRSAIALSMMQPLPQLVLADSGTTGSGWTLCDMGGCRELGCRSGEPIVLRRCADGETPAANRRRRGDVQPEGNETAPFAADAKERGDGGSPPYQRPVMPGKKRSNATARIWSMMKGTSALKMMPSVMPGGATDFR